ncbi:phosphodiesterase [Brevibacillus laterosporus]|uniref:phosphodiesterase n=1 Tax=Brevibacillus laterosporus TaxID=1465 RepID=UPI000CE3967F|nr:phosphodiesterase [Brevibacillus laterosporus]MBG9797755.1 phosphodiesterase [Brevibacillus laterosporus]MCR8939630.1 phosphodiesterase [Brevibacillus laterosporus]MCZ0842270.1 phosphodiesterase [Brevibacillus laterosporus]MCZ0846213.1 phosphodiesterase [Brevibacillus laterosporus]MED1912648.1 phosphodiesterase [Brevibacillus laterosporus]
MKLFFLSDIHGSLTYAQVALEAFEREQATHLILLGDVMYHGPRNALPDGYNPSEVANLLNRYSNSITAVRGNCDSEVDQMLLHFPIMSDSNTIITDKRRIFVTHGHIYHEDHHPVLSVGDVLIHGHTHIPMAKKKGDLFILNPGSIAIPKENHPHTYGVIEDDQFLIKKLDGEVYIESSLVLN